MQNKRYPRIYIWSKNELAKRISHSKFSKVEALARINDAVQNFNNHWKDNQFESRPEKDKYVRTAKNTSLGKLLDSINRMVLAPHDKMLPGFIFGGVNGLSHIAAAEYLLGSKRRRVALKMDIKRFFEQISHERVYQFFLTRCECSKKASKLLADLCCVPIGPKGSTDPRKTIARGFATSSRLAVWCNLDTFIKLEHLVKKRFKGRNPRIAIYVDDIGITATGLTKEEMWTFSIEVQELLGNNDVNQKLPVNEAKTCVTSHDEGIEHLGVELKRNKLGIGIKTKSKMSKAKIKLRGNISVEQRKQIQDKLQAMHNYKRYVENGNH